MAPVQPWSCGVNAKYKVKEKYHSTHEYTGDYPLKVINMTKTFTWHGIWTQVYRFTSTTRSAWSSYAKMLLCQPLTTTLTAWNQCIPLYIQVTGLQRCTQTQSQQKEGVNGRETAKEGQWERLRKKETRLVGKQYNKIFVVVWSQRKINVREEIQRLSGNLNCTSSCKSSVALYHNPWDFDIGCHLLMKPLTMLMC